VGSPRVRHQDMEHKVESEFVSVQEISGNEMDSTVSIVRETATGTLYVRKAICFSGLPKQTRKLLAQEGPLLGELHHPNIVQLHTCFEEPGPEERQVLILENIQGIDCEKLLREHGGTINEELVVEIMAQLMEALRYCHEKGIVHRDVNPSNVVFAGSLHDQAQKTTLCKLIDFGFATSCKDSFVDVVGTPPYMAPELLARKPMGTAKVDIWAAGCFAIQLLCGTPPFGRLDDYNGNERRLYTKVRAYDASKEPDELFDTLPHWQELSVEARSFLRSAMQPKPDARFTAAKALSHPWLTHRRQS